MSLIVEPRWGFVLIKLLPTAGQAKGLKSKKFLNGAAANSGANEGLEKQEGPEQFP